MKKTLMAILFTIFFITQMSLSWANALFPIIDVSGVDGLPLNIRKVQREEKDIGTSSINFQGLECVRASGSGQFSEKYFKEITDHLLISSNQLIILDLRQESHGFINGEPVSWTDGDLNYVNLGRTRSEIETDELERLKLAEDIKKIILNSDQSPIEFNVRQVATERAMVEELGSTYIRLPVTNHNPPSNKVTDQFVELIKNLSEDQWLHIHCKAGKGRTTIFLTLFDIMKNSQSVSLKDIIDRQQFIGGSDYQVTGKEGERKLATERRYDFIQRFYLYCKEVPDFKICWSTWVEQQKNALVNNS